MLAVVPVGQPCATPLPSAGARSVSITTSVPAGGRFRVASRLGNDGGTGINWPLAFVTGIIGSFVGGLFFSLLAGDGLELRPSGIIGSIFGAVLVTLLWDWIQKRRAPKKDEAPRPHVG